MSTHHILLAIDGSGSKSWRNYNGTNSHVYRFFNDFNGQKKYLDGPSNLGVGERTGFKDEGDAVGTIIDNGASAVYEMIGKVLNTYQNISIGDININLIGHSRGGFVALKIANILQNPNSFLSINRLGNERIKLIKDNTRNSSVLDSIKVNFIGLYDSVDMTAQIEAVDLSLRNVDYIAHAWRLNKHLSRKTFGGMDIPKASQKPFDTSHGGVGGDPGFFNEIKIGNDIYCNALCMLNDEDAKKRYAKLSYLTGSKLYFEKWIPYNPNDYDSAKRHIKKVWAESKEADNFIRNEASKKGLPLPTKTQHLPTSLNDIAMYSELRTKIGF